MEAPTTSKQPTTYDIIRTGDHIMTSKAGGDIVEFKSIRNREDYTEVKTIDYANNAKIAYWGKNNQLPQHRERIILDNNIVGELIATKAAITIGGGIYAYNEVVEAGVKREERIAMPAEIQKWLDENQWDDYLECAAGELFKHANVPTEFIQVRKRSSTEISKLHLKPCKNIRAGVQNVNGKVPVYYYHGSWSQRTANNTGIQEAKAIPIPTYNGKRQIKSLFHTGTKLFFDGYYYKPNYWGGKEWIITSNNIPKFHQHNLENGYNIRFHIEIPFDYFLDRVAYDAADDGAARTECMNKAAAAEQTFIDAMNNFLAGVKNSGRAVYTKFKHDMEKSYPGIKITPLKVDLKDEALLKLYDKSNDANISAQGIHPTLASIQTQGKLSSGSDIRNSLMLYLATKAPGHRRTLLKPLKIVQKANGWDSNIKFGFEDTLITKLDDNPDGIEKTASSQQDPAVSE